MKAFEEALMADPSSPSQPGSPTVPQSIGTTRIRKVSAMSDFAPVNIKVNKCVSIVFPPTVVLIPRLDGGKGVGHLKRNKSGYISSYAGRCWSVYALHPFSALRPDQTQFLIGLFIACEFGCYVAIRQVVNAKEWLSACQSGPS